MKKRVHSNVESELITLIESRYRSLEEFCIRTTFPYRLVRPMLRGTPFWSLSVEAISHVIQSLELDEFLLRAGLVIPTEDADKLDWRPTNP